eukprot:SAG31_NODE_37918_length_300_cov_0.980100_1_plen_52_part_01
MEFGRLLRNEQTRCSVQVMHCGRCSSEVGFYFEAPFWDESKVRLERNGWQFS